MKKTISSVLLALCATPFAASADPVLQADAFGSHISTSSNATPPAFEPSGSGGGLRAKVSLPLTGVFIAAESQRNSLSDNGTDLDLTDSRAGLGLEFSIGPTQFYSKAEFVHLLGESTGSRDNDDGVGIHVGANFDLGPVGVYASAGALMLSEGKGPEILFGGQVSLMPTLALIGEYRYTNLHSAFGTNNTINFNDFRVGIRLSL